MDIEEALRFLKVLADESRLKLVGILARRERSVGEMAEILGLKEPTVSHHLARLLEAGLVVRRAEGTAHFYRLETGVLERLSREMFATDQMQEIAAESGADAWEEKVLRTYLEGKTLSKIPQTRKKRDVILRWLATQFEWDRRYPEAEVNEVIQRHHPDSATLRRELVGAKLMDRENAVYWRTGVR